jgi:hypothetical protein
MNRFALPLLAALGLAALAPAPSAQTLSAWGATLRGDNEVPPNGSTAIGYVHVVYMDFPGGATDSFVVRGNFEGLGSNFSANHLHEAPAGSNGPIVQGLSTTLEPDNTSGEWLAANNKYAAPAGFLADLQAGLIYCNVHSASLPGGEIRGQLRAVPLLDGDLSDDQYRLLAFKLNGNNGFGDDLDVTRLYYYADLADEALYVGVAGEVNTGSFDGIGLWLDFSEVAGAPAGTALGGVPGAGHYLGTGAYTADFEVDYAFALNPGGGGTNAFFDVVKYVGTVQADYLGSSDQGGTLAMGPADDFDNDGRPAFIRAVGFAFDNSRTTSTGLEFVIPFAELGIEGGAAETMSAFAFGVSSTAYFSDVTAPGNVTAGNLGFDPSFSTNTTSAGCACPSPSAPIGVGPYHATGSLGAAPNFDLVAFNVTPLSVQAGGSVQFRYAISNNTGNPVTGDLFFTATGGLQGVIQSGTVQPGATIGPLSFTQQVPGGAPPGTYTYTLRIGQFPGTTVDSVPFTVTIAPAPRQAAPPAEAAAGWSVVHAEPWSGASAPAAAAAARGAAGVTAYPNPFGRATQLAFTLERATDVSLVVYDVRGREVARLVEGRLEAGAHEARFDASALPSGLYLYRLQAGPEVQTGRLTVLR